MKAGFLLMLTVIVVLASGCGNRDALQGKWSQTETGADGAVQTTTYQFLSDGLAAVEAKTSKGSLLKPDSGVSRDAFATLVPTVARVNSKGTYTVKDDVLTFKITDFNLYDPQNQLVSLPNATHDPSQTIKFKVDGDKLTLDKLDGTPATVYTRQKS